MKQVTNTFDEALSLRNIGDVMNNTHITKRLPMNSTKFVAALKDAIDRGEKIWIDPDCDPDGYFSGLIAKTALDKIGYTKYAIAKHAAKRHNLSAAYLTSIIDDGYRLALILDSSSNDMEGIRFLCEHGVTVLIADHHRTNYIFKDYPAGCIIVNPKIDTRFKTAPYSEVSAGALSAMLFDFFLSTQFNIKDNQELYIYGYVTLYSDSCDMGNEFNRGFVYDLKDSVLLPELLDMFSNQWSSLNRGFISYTMVPRINSLIRCEEFDFVYRLFYDRTELVVELESTLRFIETILQQSKNRVKDAEDKGRLYTLKNLVCQVLPQSMQSHYRNFTGLIASRLAEKYNRTGVCLVQVSSPSLEGSVRDTHSRDILPAFQTVCFAEGHGPAFGVEMPVSQLETSLEVIDNLDEVFAQEHEVIVVDWDSESTTELRQAELNQMALYNEFSGGRLPEAFITLTTLPGNCKYFNNSPKVSRAKFMGLFDLVSFDVRLEDYMTLLCKPSYNGLKVQMVVKTVLTKFEGEK